MTKYFIMRTKTRVTRSEIDITHKTRWERHERMNKKADLK